MRASANLDGRFLDYGGSGLFVRVMRDRGLRFFRHDPVAQPVFSRHFDLGDLPEAERRFELVTAFEVLEHLPRPVETLEQLLRSTDTLLCTTDLVPTSDVNTLADGGTSAPRTGNTSASTASTASLRSRSASSPATYLSRPGSRAIPMPERSSR